MNTILPQLINSIGFAAYTIAAAYLVMMFVLAFSVSRDAYVRRITNKGTFLLGPIGWFFVILLTGGFTGALGYWLIHYSSLRYVARE